jgi:hypothetical protein
MSGKQPPTPDEVMRMSRGEFHRACQDLAAREAAKYHARLDAIETKRTLDKFGPATPRQDQRLQQIDAKLAELKQHQQDKSVATKIAALEQIRKDISK